MDNKGKALWTIMAIAALMFLLYTGFQFGKSLKSTDMGEQETTLQTKTPNNSKVEIIRF